MRHYQDPPQIPTLNQFFSHYYILLLYEPV